jgi:hypothetical protein
MKALYILVILLFVPSLSFASKECSLLGGECKYSCATNESSLPGFFVDCEYRQLCCKRVVKPADGKGVQKGTHTGKTPEDVRSTSGETSKEGSLTGEARGTSVGGGGQILVCYPVQDAYANPETLLECGDRHATLNNLYEENYRLIQIVRGEKLLYYLEKR